MKYIINLEKNNNGTKLIWRSTVDKNIVTTKFGQEDGKIQTKVKKYTETKNPGKKNESSPQDQALKITCKKAKDKVDRGYKYSDCESKKIVLANLSDTVVKSHSEVPQCTLCNDATKPGHWKKVAAQKEVLLQRKIDGNRALVNLKTGKIYSRTQKEIGSLPHLGKEVKAAFAKIKTEWADGELYSPTATFNDIQSIIRKKASKMTDEDIEKAKTIGIDIFDYVDDAEQHQRQETLKTKLMPNKYVRLVKTIKASPSEIQKYHDQFVAEGYEGAIIRFTKDGGYTQKRSLTMFKYKNFIDEEYKVVGIVPEKTDKTKLGTFICTMKNGTEFKARPACTDEEKAYMFAHPKEFIGKWATVKYQMLDEKTGTPRFGVIKGFRAASDIDRKGK